MFGQVILLLEYDFLLQVSAEDEPAAAKPDGAASPAAAAAEAVVEAVEEGLAEDLERADPIAEPETAAEAQLAAVAAIDSESDSEVAPSSATIHKASVRGINLHQARQLRTPQHTLQCSRMWRDHRMPSMTTHHDCRAAETPQSSSVSGALVSMPSPCGVDRGLVRMANCLSCAATRVLHYAVVSEPHDSRCISAS